MPEMVRVNWLFAPLFVKGEGDFTWCYSRLGFILLRSPGLNPELRRKSR